MDFLITPVFPQKAKVSLVPSSRRTRPQRRQRISKCDSCLIKQLAMNKAMTHWGDKAFSTGRICLCYSYLFIFFLPSTALCLCRVWEEVAVCARQRRPQQILLVRQSTLTLFCGALVCLAAKEALRGRQIF